MRAKEEEAGSEPAHMRHRRSQEVLGFRCSWENSKNIVTPRLVLKRPSGIPRCQEHLFGLGHRASSFLTYKTGIVLVPTQRLGRLNWRKGKNHLAQCLVTGSA